MRMWRGRWLGDCHTSGLGRQREPWAGRKKTEQRSANGQEHRIRRADPARCTRQNYGGNEETEQLLEFMHTDGVASALRQSTYLFVVTR